MRPKTLVRVLIAVVLIGVLTTGVLIAQRVLNPTYEYYGEVLSASEFLELFNANTPLACGQKVDSSFVLRGFVTVDYVCFGTLDEVDAYLGVHDE